MAGREESLLLCEAGARASLLVNGTACVPGQGTREPCDHDMQDRLESEAQHQPQGVQREFPKPHGREETEVPEEGGQEQAEKKEARGSTGSREMHEWLYLTGTFHPALI